MSFAEMLQFKLGEHLTEEVNNNIIIIIILYSFLFLLKIDRRINT